MPAFKLKRIFLMEYLIPVMCKKLCIPCDLDLEKVISTTHRDRNFFLLFGRRDIVDFKNACALSIQICSR